MDETTNGRDRRNPAGFHYQSDPAEDMRVNAMRVAQAIQLREALRDHLEAPVTDLDFAYWLHRYTYEDARRLAAYALDIHRQGRQG